MDRQLPSLDPGLVCLDATDAPTALYRLVGRTLADEAVDGPATAGPTYWLDARNTAAPATIREHAPRTAARSIRVARAFTGYQHYELVRELLGRAAPDAALVVAPNLGALYAEDDVPENEADAMVEVVLGLLGQVASALEIPVLVTAGDPTYRDRVRDAADRLLTAVRTGEGLRVEGPEFRTEVYWSDGGFQTTIAYWVDLLGTAASPRPVPSTDTALVGI